MAPERSNVELRLSLIIEDIMKMQVEPSEEDVVQPVPKTAINLSALRALWSWRPMPRPQGRRRTKRGGQGVALT